MSERDRLEVDALVTDHYLESLLAARDRRDRMPPAPPPALDPGVGATAAALEAGLTRVHPSFRFAERLAADLQAAAARQRIPGRSRRAAQIRRLEPRSPLAGRTGAPASAAAPGAPVSRPLLIGSALTSAALSIAGAYVAWRRGRPPVDPMVRAVRAAHRTGIARRIPNRASRLSLPGARQR